MDSSSQKIDLTTFFLSISSAALMGLGIVPSAPDYVGKPELNLELTKQNIELLELMEEKTRGNRTLQEDQLLEQLFFALRMRYLEHQKQTSLA